MARKRSGLFLRRGSSVKDLKEKTIRGGLARICAQGMEFVLRLVGLMVLARLLGPKDFGLVGMVTAFTGFLGLFRDFGLSSAAIQSTSVTEDQLSTLFWINVAFGAVLGVVACALAPVIAAFYHDPRLLGVTAALATAFLFNAAGVQHGVLLQREMRFTVVAIIKIISLIAGTAIGIGGALAGYGYWSLVAMSITFPLVITIGCWVATGWVPGSPRRRSGMRSMMRFGGTVTLNSLVGYLATNFEKILLGRFWGADVLGLYGRAYQLINIPTDGLNSSAGEVAFSALSRLQNDPGRLRSYFLKGYSLILTLTLPITLICALFANDVITVFLGPKWMPAVPLFRLLAPTILVFAIINPLNWLLPALGLVGRSLKMVLVFAPVMIAGDLVALRFGPKGVAFAYSMVMVLWAIPAIAWAVQGTMFSLADFLRTVSKPLISSIVAAACAFAVRLVWGNGLPTLARLVLEVTVLLAVYSGLTWFVTGQKSLYLDLLRGLKGSRPAAEEEALVPSGA
jgi:O-antigen/teichoic acid export membrane protein